MSGPTWLPPKQPEPARTPQGRALPRGPPGPLPPHGAALQPHPRVNFCPLPSEQCYQPSGGPEDRGPAWVGSHGAPQRLQGLPPDRGCLRPGSLDAEIDSLTCMLAELDGGRSHVPPRRPDRQGPLSQPPEEELERLTKKLMQDMSHPPSGEYFGRCGGCGEVVVGDGAGVVALDRVFHVGCFVCSTCRAQLRGQHFYAVERRAYCESCYVATLEKCSTCSQPILDRILRAMGKAYHPGCFTCVVCHRGLDGIPFTVDATSQIHCIEDFHRKFAPRCSVCGRAIMPEPGQEETVRIVALDRSFHIGCYKCEECGLLLSSEGECQGCYPLDGHILCKACSAWRIQELSATVTTDC
ncbi:thyroid receptor-interacting protein 6 isoform X2 [Dipodomys spectabilis]|uniref:thyroid receptor-interacting protein 6 isoform X2 n=1 Tax=Dipodomys spectabilis TaxID=105255 RepID=UPI001C54BF95|nr:thyroid receptor-interacting protein 6 isoform X2 [Dipodomys spectabilis]